MTLMKYLKLATGIVVLAMGLIVTDATAAGGKDPFAIKVESPFKGVVSNVSSSSVTVKGEVQLANPDKTNTNSKSKPILDSIRFSVKGAKLTRDGKPCEMKDAQKGDSVTVEFSTKEGSDKRVATDIRFSTKGSAVDTETKPEKQEPKPEKQEKGKKK